MDEPRRGGASDRGGGLGFLAFRTIRLRLLALLLIGAIPGAVVAALNAHTAFREAERRLLAEVGRARDLAAARIGGRIDATAQGLTTAAELLPQDRLRDAAGCAATLAAIPAGRGTGVALLAPDGTVRCAVPDEAGGGWPGGMPDRIAAWSAAVATGRAGTGLGAAPRLLGTVGGGAAPGAATVTLAVPLPPPPTEEGRRATPDGVGALLAVLPLPSLAESGGIPAGGEAGSRADGLVWLAAADGEGQAVPLTRAAAATAPPAAEALRRRGAPVPAAGGGGGAAFEASAADGTPLFLALAPIGPGLVLAVAEPSAAPLRAAWDEVWRRFLELTSLFLVCTAAVAFGVGTWVIRPLQRLREALRRWHGGNAADGGSGGVAKPSPPGLPGEDRAGWPEEVRDLATGFEQAAERLAAHETALRAALERSELLMAEVHHRVRNNLQIISSLLNLQAGRITEPVARAEFEAARDRVRALATLHRHLYMHPDHEAVDLGAFIEELAGQIFQASGERPGERIVLAIDAPSLRISSDQAVPLALVITEAVTNALSYAFPGGRRGRLEVTVTAEGDHARLSVRDDGIGGGFDRAADRRGLGQQLVRSLARQLGGEVRVETGAGTVVALEFPLRPPIERPPPGLLRGAKPPPVAAGAATPAAPPAAPSVGA